MRKVAGLIQSKACLVRGETMLSADKEYLTPDSDCPDTFRTVFISDAHLGYKGVRAGELLQFLRGIRCERLVIVGDLIDGWVIRKGWHWTVECDLIVRRLLKMATKHGTEIIYVPGNHDDPIRRYDGVSFAGVTIHREYIHETIDGKRLLVIHGDEFDMMMRQWQGVAHLSHWAFGWMRLVNKMLNSIRRFIGSGYWSLSEWTRRSIQRMAKTERNYAIAVTNAARHRGLDGVVCGHIHRAEQKIIDGIEYHNTGDWMEDTSAICEMVDGTMMLIRTHSPTAHPYPSMSREEIEAEFSEIDQQSVEPMLDVEALA